jgi:hypothetical protein
MRAYGQETEGRGIRENPDKGDIAELGLSSRHGKNKAKSRRASRRILKKKARQAARRFMARYVEG